MKKIFFTYLLKSYGIALGIILAIITTGIVAFTISNFNDGDVLTASRINELRDVIVSLPNWGKGTNGNDAVFLNGNVGIGVNSPNETLQIIGGLNIGNTNNSNTGSIRWNGNDFEGYAGSKWISLTNLSVPLFRVSKNVDQNLTDTNATLLTWQTENTDSHNYFENNRYTPQKSGKYIFNICLLVTGVANTFKAQVFIKKNTSNYFGDMAYSVGQNINSCFTKILEANGTADYFEAYVIHNDTDDNAAIYSSANYTFFEGYWIGN